MFTATQLVAHLIGDYLLQSHWMAIEKTKKSLVAFLHALAYAIPFLLLCQPSWLGWIGVVLPHFIIDRWRLARHVVFAKNFLAPPSTWPKWKDCQATGYDQNVPTWLSVWLMILADNTMHILTNAIALSYL